MKRHEFISQLKTELAGLPSNEIDDIIRDQNEMLDDAMASGRSEEDVVQSFGSPKELANSLKAEIKIDHAAGQKHLGNQVKGAVGAVGALLVLAPFNLIFVLGPFCALAGILFGGWAASLAIGLVALALLVVFFTKLIFVSATASVYFAILFAFLALLGIGYLLLMAMYSVTRFILNIVISYLRWNLNFITSRA
jgi:uncharacterized membrane protein